MDTLFQQAHSPDLTAVAREFEDWIISSFTVAIGSGQVVAYCCQSTLLSSFTEQWQQINSYLAAKYVAKNKQPFERWNSYLLFVCADNIPNTLRYEMENNKFAMRKIVVGNAGEVLDDSALRVILDREILSTNVRVTSISCAALSPLILSNVTTDLIAANLQSGRGIAQENRKKWLDKVLDTARQLAKQQQGDDNEN
jgi:hypothetical protein